MSVWLSAQKQKTGLIKPRFCFCALSQPLKRLLLLLSDRSDSLWNLLVRLKPRQCNNFSVNQRAADIELHLGAGLSDVGRYVNECNVVLESR